MRNRPKLGFVNTYPIQIYILIIISFAGIINCSHNEERKMNMPDNSNIVKEIKNLTPDDEDSLEQIAESITKNSQEEPRQIVNLLHSGSEDDFKKAAFILMEIGDLSFIPLLDSLSEDPSEDYVWDMETLVEIQLSHRHKITKILNAMLLDTRDVPVPEYPMQEEQPIPRRVCDEAYLMLRKLLSFEETEDDLFLNSQAFLELSDEERDEEIQRVKSSKRWISLTEHFFDDME